jgi:ribosomal protein S18 acetylase RimI-like enzyme
MITYQKSLNGILQGDLTGFFEGWKPPVSPEKHLEILNNSYKVILALDGNKVIGFINAISDKLLSAYIPMLEVLPEYRGKGIGKELVNRMLGELKKFYMVDLCCDEELSGFYEKIGMRKSAGMIKRNYDALIELKK